MPNQSASAMPCSAKAIQAEETVEVGEAFDTREWQLATNVFDGAVKEHMCWKVAKRKHIHVHLAR